MHLGAHVPVTGGLGNAPANGTAIGAEAIQIFTRNQMQWACRPLAEEECAAFREALAKSAIRRVLTHGSYLVNLASPNRDFLRKSRECMVTEVERCHRLGIPYVVFHPGAHMGAGEEEGLAAIARSLDHVLERTAGLDVMLLLEATAGQGTSLGHRFEHLAGIFDRVRAPERLGVCLDTCHVYAAGYDIATPEGYERTLRAFARVVGLDKLKAIHLNDSKREKGSRVDRHARAGEGLLGLDTFARILNDRRFRGLPLVVETPGPIAEWKKEIARLRALVRPAARAAARRARRPAAPGADHTEPPATVGQRHRARVEDHHPGELLQDLLDGGLQAGGAVDGLQHLAEGLRLLAALALTLDGGRGVEPAPLARDLLAQRVQDLRAVGLAHAGQPLLHLADEALGVHGGRDCTAKRSAARGLESLVARERILFLCTANVDRSPTAEDLYREDPRYEVRSAGIAPFARREVTREDLLWADRVFVMSEREDRHRTLLEIRFPGLDRPVVDLDVEDRWARGHPELVRRLLRSLAPHLGAPREVAGR